ncbi:putative NAD dependent epimerase/dehydratase [Leptodontidium sp. MPI-SDFR-AT-0119]|nr:putative NAD dependent epimerase/dehydratase [Leptodontidium sp. MPI-SDFR-AT-0119]
MALPKSKNELVLISGVNGYIASQTAKSFLDAGYSVRGTARSLASASNLIRALQLYVDAGRFEVVEVKDIVVPGAFDETVKEVNAVAHMASPVSQFFTDPDPIIRTAVEGTLSILHSALAYGGSQLRSVVLMSSVGTVMEPKTGPYTFTEADWNSVSESEVARLGKDTPGGHIYRASKIAAEKAFWKFRDENHPNFTMTTINPTYVCGPPLVLPDDPANINETVRAVWKILSGQAIPPPLGASGSFVDVRDVAELMVFGVEKSHVANGQRYIACAGVGGEQAIADILNEAYPNRELARGEPGKGYLPTFGFAGDGPKIDATKASQARGKEWIGYKQSVLDAAKAFEHYL